ncbi:hypothetical protein P4O66_017047, partial [Electrophorus voltai]
MGRKLDLSSLTEEEAEHVLQVVQRDRQLRKSEEDRLRCLPDLISPDWCVELKQELEEEKTRCALLSRQPGFNERCCMLCCSPFSFLLASRQACHGCGYNVCRHCRRYTRDGWLCSACQRTRLLKTCSLEWFYSSVRRRFKRFGSDKVLKTLYRRLITPCDSQGEFTEGSTYESAGNESSVYESDSTFYRHSNEHSMAETTCVAQRVAEEAVDEAVAKSKRQTHNEQKLKEAQYMQDNRGELIEGLTTVIMQKIIRRRRETPETQPEPADGNSQASFPSSPGGPEAVQKRQRSAVALHTGDEPDREGRVEKGHTFPPECTQGLKKEGAAGSTLPSWKSVDRLDASSASMLQSPDGNWIAMQSTQLSRPSLLTKRKSLVFTALEKESGAVSAYDGLCSDTEPDTAGAWGAALLEFRHKMSSNNTSNDLLSTSPQSPAQTTAENTQSDSGQNTPVLQPHKGQFPVLKRKVSREHRRPSLLDITFYPDSTESSEEGSENNRAKRTRRKRKSKQERADQEGFMSLTSSEPDYSMMLLEVLTKHQIKKQSSTEVVNDKPVADTSDTATQDTGSSGAVTPGAPEVEDPGIVHHLLTGSLDHQLTSTLVQLTDPSSEKKDDTDKEVEMVGKRNANIEQEAVEGTEEMERGKERQAGRKPLVVVTQDEECPVCSRQVGEENIVTASINVHKKTHRIDREVSANLHDKFITEKQSENYMEKPAGIPQETCLGQESETAGEAKEHEESEADSIRSEVRTGAPSVLLSWRSKRTSEEEQAENTEAGRSGRGQTGSTDHEQVKDQTGTGVETLQEQESQSASQLKKQEAAGEVGAEKNREAESRRSREAESRRSREAESRRSRTLDNVEREIEVDLCDTASDVTAEQREEDNEIGREQKEEMEDDVERRQDKERVTENEREYTRVQTTEEKSCIMKSEESGDHTFKECPDSALPGQEELLTPEEIYRKYSAASLRSITTEVLKVLNATEDLIQGTMGDKLNQSESQDLPPLPPAQSKKLDEQLSHLEENVYVAASTAFGLEAELEDLAECARSVWSATTEGELTHLEEQVASAAAQVQQSELQVTDIAARIAALKNAGLNVAPQTRVTKVRTKPSLPHQPTNHRRMSAAPATSTSTSRA